MTYDELVTMLEEANLPLAYDHFAEGESPEQPFLIFLNLSDEIFGADNISYAAFLEINVELYTDKKDPELEKKLEGMMSFILSPRPESNPRDSLKHFIRSHLKEAYEWVTETR